MEHTGTPLPPRRSARPLARPPRHTEDRRMHTARWHWTVTVQGPDGQITTAGTSIARADKPVHQVAEHILRDLATQLGYAPLVTRLNLDRTD